MLKLPFFKSKKILYKNQNEKIKFRKKFLVKSFFLFFAGAITLCLFVSTYILVHYYFDPSAVPILISLSSPNYSTSDGTDNLVTAPSIINYFFPSNPDKFNKNASPASNPSVISDQRNITILYPELSFGSYFDDFPNSVYIDKKNSSLYHDETATAIFFPPVYDWQEANNSVFLSGSNSALANYFADQNLNNFDGPRIDKRCLGRDCLEQNNNDLSFNGRKINLPTSINKGDIVAISISALSKHWLVGLTLNQGGEYRGSVFYFDGNKFTEIATPSPVKSKYFGLWGFGGEESDFLMIYGAYDGIAYRVRGDNLTDISKFFAIRAMNNGFKAEVIRTVHSGDINWYVYSSTLNHPWLIKLWQNRTPEIVGEVFFSNLFSGDTKSAVFKFLDTNESSINLLAEIKNKEGNVVGKIFRDHGFNNNAKATLVTVPITNDGNNSKIIIKKIENAKLGLDVGSQALVKYLFSADCQIWRDLPSEKNVDFLSEPLSSFCLKVIFLGQKDRFYSPFLSSMIFNYYREAAE